MSEKPQPPVLDGRSRDELVDRMRAIAPHYTAEWDPDSNDPGTVMLEIFADLVEDVIDRLDRVPEKHQMAFFDSLDFRLYPPQSSRAPLTFSVSESAEENVVVPPRTTVAAGETESHPERRFETVNDGEFEATPARITDAFGVDPGTDRIIDHWASLEEGERTQLFTGRNVQEHVFYLGDEELLNLNPGSTFRLDVATNAPEAVLYDFLEWEYYGEDEDGETGWHPLHAPDTPTASLGRLSESRQVKQLLARMEPFFDRHGYVMDSPEDYEALVRSVADDIRKGRFGETEDEGTTLPMNLFNDDAEQVADAVVDRLRRQFIVLQDRFRAASTGSVFRQSSSDDAPVSLTFEIHGEVGTHEVNGTESRWIRCRIPADELSNALFTVEFESITFAAGETADGELISLDPDEMYANDVPLSMVGSTGDGPVDGGSEGADGGGSGADSRADSGRGVGLEGGPADDVDGLDDPVGSASGDVYPLGTEPGPAATFSLACEEAFTKDGATVSIRFTEPEMDGASGAGTTSGGDGPGGIEADGGTATEPGGDSPSVSWQYWNGDGWRHLRVTDDTNALSRPGTVTFAVPEDIAATELFGHEGHWVQARLVDGNYGEARVEEVAENRWERVTDHISPPCFGSIEVEYVQEPQPFDTLYTFNNLTFVEASIDEPDAEFGPFTPPIGSTQALYLGFDGPLRNGPIPLYFPLESNVYPDSFTPRIAVEYCSDPKTNAWTKLSVKDGTEDLTERGLLEMVFPEETEAFTLFGRKRHWVRLRVTEDEFARSDNSILVSKERMDATSTRQGSLSLGSVEESTGAPDRSRTSPVLYGIHPNTYWAENAETIESERLGSSSGNANQAFSFSNTPVMDPEVWVDEGSTLSARDRRRLERARPSMVETEERGGGTPDRFWVQWEEVDDFFDSGPDDRHFVMDRTGGTITFGDGRRGAIPPAGEQSIKATYRTGGGSDGDVGKEEITKLVDSITFVDSVTNPEAGYGGEDEETVEELIDRAPKQLLDREKPVTVDGFERVASATSRELAKVRCESGIDRTDRSKGVITLLIVPDTDERKPTPTVDLAKRIEEAMHEAAPATVADGENTGLVVRAPNYVEMSVDATVEMVSGESISDVKETVETELTRFSHPLTGGPDGDGWEIGTVPAPSVVSAHIEQLPSVNRVEKIAVTFEEAGDELTLTDAERAPTVAPDVLIFSGRHDVTVTMGGV